MLDRPNILMITTDHWFQKLMGIAGHKTVMTPTLDALSRDGIRYTNCYSQCPVCIPARRTLMTGLSPKSHGDRVYSSEMEMPDVKTLAGTFSQAGYQTYAVGKLHVFPQRNRIGFDDVILMEEGRYEYGVVDDYQTWLANQGFPGMEFMHGMGNNTYYSRPWHLPEYTHPVNWVTSQMINTIKRKDPTRPAFYYASYQQPHPPLIPLEVYYNMYLNEELEGSIIGDWNNDDCYPLKELKDIKEKYSKKEMDMAKKAFYALCTHVDHQIRLLVGTLKEEGLLDNTIILFTSDHGDMLFDHSMVAKRVFYENSCNVPLIISGKSLQNYRGTVDDRLVSLDDIMPTLLDLCNIEIPNTVEGISVFSNKKKEYIYGEIGEDDLATRMIYDGEYKLIYYPVGNCIQLFNIKNDPDEKENLSNLKEFQHIKEGLITLLIDNLYKGDLQWVKDGNLVGVSDKEFKPKSTYTLYNQRGGHWPPPTDRLF